MHVVNTGEFSIPRGQIRKGFVNTIKQACDYIPLKS